MSHSTHKQTTLLTSCPIANFLLNGHIQKMSYYSSNKNSARVGKGTLYKNGGDKGQYIHWNAYFV